MRTISLLICIFGLALSACAEKTPPPRSAAAPTDRSAGMTPAEGSGADSGTPEARPEPRKADPSGTPDDMDSPKPDGAAGSSAP